ncbi:hypothetical protein LZK75_37765 (plasmid) [Rhizobium leguminosarum]|nr:hypothetical protein LZK75_37765 [Rhizobium leguminosarum]
MTEFRATKFQDLKHELVNPTTELAAPTVFSATLQAHGVYNTRQFVLRLSPRVHELVDALSSGDFSEYDPAEIVQAYSTYIHETVHWWQHVGSTSGLIYSLCYPAQFSSSLEHLRIAIQCNRAMEVVETLGGRGLGERDGTITGSARACQHCGQ